MKWNRNHINWGTRKGKSKFLFFPKKFGHNWYWMETVKIECFKVSRGWTWWRIYEVKN